MLKRLIISIAFIATLFSTGPSVAAELVNINKASAAAIQQNLVGIGPIKAEAIVSYRKKNGKFGSLDDLQSVKGLGPALIKKNKRYLSLSKGAVSGDDKAYAASKKQAGKSKSSSKSTKKQTTSKAKKSTSAASKKAKSTTKTKSKTKTKASKSKKVNCSGSTKTMSKAEKKACAAKKAKKPASKKSTTKKKPAKKKTKKKAKPAS